MAARARVGRRTLSARGAWTLGPDQDPAEVARQVCLDQLSYTARTRAELESVLAARGVPDGIAAQVLDRLGEVGLVDDTALAQAWVARRSGSKGLSRRRLGDELRRRGVDGGVAEAALTTLSVDDEQAAARALVDARLPATAGLEPAARARRLVGLLARKGYGPGQAYAVVRAALADEDPHTTGDPSGDLPADD